MGQIHADTFDVGTQKAVPVYFPFSSGMTLSLLLVMPADVEVMFMTILPYFTTVFWVMAWTVVMSPSMMPKLSWMPWPGR